MAWQKHEEPFLLAWPVPVAFPDYAPHALKETGHFIFRAGCYRSPSADCALADGQSLPAEPGCPQGAAHSYSAKEPVLRDIVLVVGRETNRIGRNKENRELVRVGKRVKVASMRRSLF